MKKNWLWVDIKKNLWGYGETKDECETQIRFFGCDLTKIVKYPPKVKISNFEEAVKATNPNHGRISEFMIYWKVKNYDHVMIADFILKYAGKWRRMRWNVEEKRSLEQELHHFGTITFWNLETSINNKEYLSFLHDVIRYRIENSEFELYYNKLTEDQLEAICLAKPLPK